MILYGVKCWLYPRQPWLVSWYHRIVRVLLFALQTKWGNSAVESVAVLPLDPECSPGNISHCNLATLNWPGLGRPTTCGQMGPGGRHGNCTGRLVDLWRGLVPDPPHRGPSLSPGFLTGRKSSSSFLWAALWRLLNFLVWCSSATSRRCSAGSLCKGDQVRMVASCLSWRKC